MIQKLKDLMVINDSIKDINSNVKEQKRIIGELSEENIRLKEDIKSLKIDFCTKTNDIMRKMDSRLGDIKSTSEDFKKQFSDFKVARTKLEERMLDKCDNSLKEQIKRVKTDVYTYNQLKSEVNKIAIQVVSLLEEITRLTDISKNIKASDFEMTGYIQKANAENNEKLMLMRKIDSLQRLVSKERKRAMY